MSVAFSPEKGLREKAYQDKPGGMPQPVEEHSPCLQQAIPTVRRGLSTHQNEKAFNDTPNATSWELAANMENAPQLVEAFHLAYPDKPSP